ncbi:hypothetical protein LSH36_29g07050 [Paralvinella palmiformis]|uniref:Uncharacterized protein n=1 Tax=Paralvinella palmiformis TaxID=53620 RepID=A0AAD9NHH3_9ANNE|nr:hypothetical protein LSH36_29g07050 [Paralvinella palmiformis]
MEAANGPGDVALTCPNNEDGIRGGLHQLTNFFQRRLGVNRQKSSESPKSDSGNGSGRNSSRGDNTLLPPIPNEGKGHLTSSNTPSSSPRPPSSIHRRKNSHNSLLSVETILTPRITDKDQLRSEMEAAQDTSSWSDLTHFYITTFETFANLNSLFKVVVILELNSGPSHF